LENSQPTKRRKIGAEFGDLLNRSVELLTGSRKPVFSIERKPMRARHFHIG
jgi:hypothetical protein